MSVVDPRRLQPLTPDQRRAAAAQFDRANQVLKTDSHEYGLQLLLNCCEIDPINPIYRQSLRQAQKARYQNNLMGQPFASLRAFPTKLKLRTALLRGHYVQALVLAERVFMRNPWDLSTHLRMAEAFIALQQPDHALWTLEQIRPVHPDHAEVNRRLARLCEKRGNFTAAIALWNVVRRVNPRDLEAQNKAKDLAASATIAKGRYEAAINGSAPTPLVGATDDTAEQQVTKEGPLTNEPTATAERQPREVAALRAKIENTPTNASAYLQLAAYYRRMDQPEQARTVLQQGMTATTNHFDISQELIDLDIEPFRRDLAVAEEKLHKESADSSLQSIRQKLVKEINTRELEYYRRRSDRFPTDTAARFEMSVRLLKAGQIDEAIRELQGIRNDPRFHGKVLFYLGFCFKNRKNSRLAQRNFEEALPHLGGSDEGLRKEAMYQLAVGYADTGEIPRAVDLACELANLDYGYKDISALLDGWQAQARR